MTSNSYDDTIRVIPLWDSVKEMYEDFDLESFRAIGGINDRLGVWSAKDNSSRYYKSLMYEFANYLNNLCVQDNVDGNSCINTMLGKIKNQNLGSPPTICFEGSTVSLDYLLGLEEYIFCTDILSDVDRVCEIGAGFGRTCHVIISLTHIKSYTIIDLPEVLALSKAYLSEVLDEIDFRKINFISADDFSSLGSFDLVINVDSLQEMPNNIGRSYLEFISANSNYFFYKKCYGKVFS